MQEPDGVGLKPITFGKGYFSYIVIKKYGMTAKF